MKKNRKSEGNKTQNNGLKIEPGKLENMGITLRAFSSFDEMNEEDAREMAGISAIEHLRNATIRIRKIFAEELKKEMTKTIKFR